MVADLMPDCPRTWEGLVAMAIGMPAAETMLKTFQTGRASRWVSKTGWTVSAAAYAP